MWVRSLGGEGPLEEGMATYPLQYSCLENTMNRGSWQATVSMGVTKSQTRLKQLSIQARMHLALPSWLIPRIAVTLQPNSQSLKCDMDLPTSGAL